MQSPSSTFQMTDILQANRPNSTNLLSPGWNMFAQRACLMEIKVDLVVVRLHLRPIDTSLRGARRHLIDTACCGVTMVVSIPLAAYAEAPEASRITSLSLNLRLVIGQILDWSTPSCRATDSMMTQPVFLMKSTV